MAFLLITAGLVLLYFGAEWLVKGAAEAAVRLGVTPLAIGLTVVAFGTSAPELTVSTHAALTGLGDIAVTNVVGSNIFNILGILGISSLVRPYSAPELTFWDLGMMLGTALLLLPLLRSGVILSRKEGLFFLVLYGAYLWHLWPR